MNLFQWLTLPCLTLLAALEIRMYVRNHQGIHLVREFVWLVAIILILFPKLTSRIAAILGIGRGTDLVFYLFMLFTIVAMFHLYGRNYVLRRDLVELARREALLSATTGRGHPSGNSDPSPPSPKMENESE